MQSLSAAERIKKLVELEGKAARNLVTWSVPVAAGAKETGCASKKRSHGNGRHGGKDRGKRREGERVGTALLVAGRQEGKENVAYGGYSGEQSLSEREEMCKYYSVKTQRQSRVTKSPSRLNLHARYWSYLFDNLHRAVDEIYRTCEADESIVECQEVIMTLEVCLKDFEALIRRIQLFGQSDLETKSSNLAWEVRKTISPGKPRRLSSLQATPSPPPPSPLHPPLNDPANSRESKPPLSHKHSHSSHLTTQTNPNHTQNQSDHTQCATATSSVPGPGSSKPFAVRSLDFSSKTSPTSNSKTKPYNAPTWAERVKGINSSTNSHTVLSSTKTQKSQSDVSPARSAMSDNGGKQLRKREELRGSLGEESTEKKVGEAGGREKVGKDGWETVTRGRTKSGSLKRFEEAKVTNSTIEVSAISTGCEGEADEQAEEHQLVGGDRERQAGNSGIAATEPLAGLASGETIVEEMQDQHVVPGDKSEVDPSGSVPLLEEEDEQAVPPDSSDSTPSLDDAESMGKQLSEKGKAGLEEFSREMRTIDNNEKGATDNEQVEFGRAAEDDRQVEDDAEQGDKETKDSKTENEWDGLSEREKPELEQGELEVTKTGARMEVVAGRDALRDGGSSSSLVEPSLSESVKMESLQLRLEELANAEAALSKPESEPWSWSDALAAYNETEHYRSEMSWADRCDSPPGPVSEVLRSPGRAIHLHQRLSSPSRKRQLEMEESRRLQEEKQAKAQLQRYKLQEEKALKSKVEADKIRGAKENRDALVRQRREALEDKLQRADMLRESHLQERIRRAQEEEAKVSEISFINTLEAQNRKLEVQEKYQGREARLQELQDERQRRKDEQLAKEEAAMERRKTIEAERHAKLLELDQRRREQEAKADQTRLEREKAREEAAKEKAKERERRLMARNIALMTSTEELERKLQIKQDESSKRYDQQLEQKKKLATGVISSRHASVEQAPRVEAYKTKKWCTLCNITIVSDVYLMSHLRGRKHQAALALLPPTSVPEGEELLIVDASEEQQSPAKCRQEVAERLQAGRKRARKLRQRLSSKAKDFENSKSSLAATYSKQRTRLQKALREVNKQVDAGTSGGSSSASGEQACLVLSASQLPAVDRALGEISRALVTPEDKMCFTHLGGVASVLKMLVLSLVDVAAGRWTLSQKTFSLALTVLQAACTSQPLVCHYLVTSNKLVPLVDLALAVLNSSSVHASQGSPQACRGSTSRGVAVAESGAGGGGGSGGDGGGGGTGLCGPILHLLASVVSTLAFSEPSSETSSKHGAIGSLVLDISGYIVSVGLMDRLRDHFTAITGPIDDVAVTKLVLGGLNLLVATTAFMHTRVVGVFSGRSCEDPTLLTVLLRQTELVGLMQLLYAILLSDGPPRHSHIPPPLTQHTLAIATATIKVVNNSAILDLKMVQACLGAEGLSLEFRHIVSYLLWYCSHHDQPGLLHELILAVGYFCVINHDNQVYLQSGRSPTLLQLLCRLPFQYFSNASLSRLLYPTLISACYQMEENKAILEEEISCKLLVTFLKTSIEKEGQRNLREGKFLEETSGQSSEKYIQVEDLSSQLCHRFPREHWEDAIVYFS